MIPKIIYIHIKNEEEAKNISSIYDKDLQNIDRRNKYEKNTCIRWMSSEMRVTDIKRIEGSDDIMIMDAIETLDIYEEHSMISTREYIEWYKSRIDSMIKTSLQS